MAKWGNFKVIHLDVPVKFINEGLKADKDRDLFLRVKKEIKKVERVQNQANHLLSVYYRIERIVGK